jgi:glutamate 5-kinase
MVDPSGTVIARGLVGFDASDVPGLLGKTTSALVAEFGEGFGRELVHRDDLVVLSRLGSRNV